MRRAARRLVLRLAGRLAPFPVLARLVAHPALADHERGRLGERLAARWLARAGVRVLGRRVRVVGVELDLLARDAEGLLVVEVKTGRTGERFRPADRLRWDQRARLERAAAFLREKSGLPTGVRTVEVATARGESSARVAYALPEPLPPPRDPRASRSWDREAVS